MQRINDAIDKVEELAEWQQNVIQFQARVVRGLLWILMLVTSISTSVIAGILVNRWS